MDPKVRLNGNGNLLERGGAPGARWEVRLWEEGRGLLETIPTGGTYADAWAVGQERARVLGAAESAEIAAIREFVPGAISFDVRPAGILVESVAEGWAVDEKSGRLVPKNLEAAKDQLPHVAVRLMANGEIAVVLESGMQASKWVMSTLIDILGARLNLLSHPETITAGRLRIELALARLVARSQIESEDLSLGTNRCGCCFAPCFHDLAVPGERSWSDAS